MNAFTVLFALLMIAACHCATTDQRIQQKSKSQDYDPLETAESSWAPVSSFGFGGLGSSLGSGGFGGWGGQGGFGGYGAPYYVGGYSPIGYGRGYGYGYGNGFGNGYGNAGYGRGYGGYRNFGGYGGYW